MSCGTRESLICPIPKLCEKLLPPCKISLKSANRLLNFSQKNDFHDNSRLQFWILKNFGYVTVIEFKIIFCVPNYMKVGWFFRWHVAIWRFSRWRLAAVRHLEFSKFRVYIMWPLSPCYSASLCEISLTSDNQLLSYGRKRLLKWRPSDILHSKKFLFDHVTVIEFQICICVPNFIKIRWFFVAIWRFYDFQDGGDSPSWTC